MPKVIIEHGVKEEETSIGILTENVPFIRVIYFAEDEDTGAQHVTDVIEYTILQDHTLPAAYIALHGIKWMEDFDVIEFHDGEVGLYGEVQRMDITDTYTAARQASCYIHMIFAHYLGFKDDDGCIIRGPEAEDGEQLFAAHVADPEGDLFPYLSAGSRHK